MREYAEINGAPHGRTRLVCVPKDEFLLQQAVIAAARALQESASSREAEATYESICRALDRLDALDAT